MNEKIQIIFGLLGGLAIFIFGMNMMSECLQKAAGEKMKSILAMLTRNPVDGCAGWCTDHSCPAEQQCDNGYGNWFCQCRSDDTASGNFHYSGCQYRYNHDGSAAGI